MIIPKGTRPMSWRSGSEGNVLCDKFKFVDELVIHTYFEAIVLLRETKTSRS